MRHVRRVVAIPPLIARLRLGWLKAVAPLNMYDMSVTDDTSQGPMGLLNALAPLNMFFMLVTSDVFHLERS